MKRIIVYLLFPLLLLFTQQETRAQKSPDLVSLLKQCPGAIATQRPLIGIARFTKSNGEIPDKYVDMMTSMLLNTLVQSNCFRVVKMPDPATGTPLTEQPQYIITGDMMQFSSETKTRKIFFRAKTTTTANVGFLLQAKKADAAELLLSKEFKEEGTSEAKESVLGIIAPAVLHNQGATTSDSIPTAAPIGSTAPVTTDEGSDKAFINALEKGVKEGAIYIMQNSQSFQAPVSAVTTTTVVTTETTTTTTSGPKQASITIANLSFAKLVELETELKAKTGVTNVEKSMKNGEGTLTFLHLGSDDELVTMLTTKFGDTIEITGFEAGKITARIK
ncbi:MAG TPA: hypothetical protein VLJ68_11670 [Chitinophagaceae bacterium]|nr:hypothetical protein [Chitinophagaceae bacterium]